MKESTLSDYVRVYVPRARENRIEPLARDMARVSQGGATLAAAIGVWQGQAEQVVTVTSYTSDLARLLEQVTAHIARLLEDGEQAVAIETREGMRIYEQP